MTLTAAQAQDVRADLSSGEVSLAFVLHLGDLELGSYITAAQWGNDTSGPAISADVTLGDVLPVEFEGEAVKFGIAVGGTFIPQILGRQSFGQTGSGSSASGSSNAQGTDQQRRATSDLLFATNGIHWQETTLDDYVEYNGWAPEDVLRDAVERVGYKHTAIYPVGVPLLYYTKDRNDSRFKPEQTVADIVSTVAPQTNWIMRDTGDGGFIAAPDIELGRDAAVPPDRAFSSGDIIDWRRPGRTKQRYSDVVVFRVNADGTDDYRISVPVTYRHQAPPPQHNAFYVTLTDDSADAPQKATQLAYNLSRQFGRGVFGDEITWPYFDPTVLKQDPFTVDDFDRDINGSWQRSWLCWVDSFKHQLQQNQAQGGGAVSFPLVPTATGAPLYTTVDYTSTLLFEDRIEVPTLIVPGYSTNVLAPLFYISVQGLYARTDISTAVRLDTSSASTAGRYFDPTLSHQEIILDTTGLWINDGLEGSQPFANNSGGVWMDPAVAMTSTSGMRYAGIDTSGVWINTTYSGTHAFTDSHGFWFDIV